MAPMVGHVGDGNFHLLLFVDHNDADEVDRAKAFLERLVDRALAMDGTCTGEHGVGQGKMKYMPAEHGEPALDVMRAIKRALDPLDIMNPGKIFGCVTGRPPMIRSSLRARPAKTMSRGWLDFGSLRRCAPRNDEGATAPDNNPARRRGWPRTDWLPRRAPSIAPINSATLCRRACAISFSAVQNASSMLTLVLWPAMTIERLITGDFIG